ncbi:MAG: sigma-70 family RNA polymerase sigma factor [Hyphomicrobiales bacterium]|nr:sigma-70 family RNA polymerase sigma factor [Hyphomicrobiales bacterium]MDE2115960.1 sigma-70 family RNA polymerase sigma factor [Hyphomicrobiales bacterium]
MKNDMLAAIPALRAFALSLSRKPDRADDLVQETLMKAWANMASFVPGTNLRAWLFTIQRNIFYSQYRKRREVEDADGHKAAMLSSPPAQLDHMDFQDFRIALDTLPVDQREALILIGASGMSYEEAAEVCGCAIGTIKSRVNRARVKLAEILGLDNFEAVPPAPDAPVFGQVSAQPPAAQAQERAKLRM